MRVNLQLLKIGRLFTQVSYFGETEVTTRELGIHDKSRSNKHTGVEVFIGSKAQCLFCFETRTEEGRGGEMRGSANFKIKDTEPLTQEKPRPL